MDTDVFPSRWSTYHDRVEENLELSLKQLGVEYLDLYLVHWYTLFKSFPRERKLNPSVAQARRVEFSW